jgi:hypothetical protein
MLIPATITTSDTPTLDIAELTAICPEILTIIGTVRTRDQQALGTTSINEGYLLGCVLGAIQIQHGRDVVRAVEKILTIDTFPDVLKQMP